MLHTYESGERIARLAVKKSACVVQHKFRTDAELIGFINTLKKEKCNTFALIGSLDAHLMCDLYDNDCVFEAPCVVNDKFGFRFRILNDSIIGVITDNITYKYYK